MADQAKAEKPKIVQDAERFIDELRGFANGNTPNLMLLDGITELIGASILMRSPSVLGISREELTDSYLKTIRGLAARVPDQMKLVDTIVEEVKKETPDGQPPEGYEDMASMDSTLQLLGERIDQLENHNIPLLIEASNPGDDDVFELFSELREADKAMGTLNAVLLDIADTLRQTVLRWTVAEEQGLDYNKVRILSVDPTDPRSVEEQLQSMLGDITREVVAHHREHHEH